MSYNNKQNNFNLKNRPEPEGNIWGQSAKILKNHEMSVGTVFNYLVCAQSLPNSVFILPQMSYPSTTVVLAIEQIPSAYLGYSKKKFCCLI